VSAPAAAVVAPAEEPVEEVADEPRTGSHEEEPGRRRGTRSGRHGLSSLDRRRLLAQGWKLYQAQRFADARATFTKLVDTKSAPGAAYLGLAKVAFQEHDYTEAAKRAQQGVKAGAGVEAHVLLGDAYYRMRKFPQARKAYADALVLEPGNAAAARSLQLAERQIQ
jgi:tetratricopeptide (TPR) repeat protein